MFGAIPHKLLWSHTEWAWKLIVLIQVVLMEIQALKLHKNFDLFKYRYNLHMNEKNINFGLNILCSLSQVNETIYTLTE